MTNPEANQLLNQVTIMLTDVERTLDEVFNAQRELGDDFQFKPQVQAIIDKLNQLGTYYQSL
jgi:predicted metal-dependent hydrolase